MGLSTIIRYSVPVLMLIYPPAIALILLAMFGKHLDHDKNVYIWVTAFTWAASIFDFFKTLPEQVQMLFHLDKAVEFAQTFLPFFHLNLGWIIPAMIGLIIGLCSKNSKKDCRRLLNAGSLFCFYCLQELIKYSKASLPLTNSPAPY